MFVKIVLGINANRVVRSDMHLESQHWYGSGRTQDLVLGMG